MTKQSLNDAMGAVLDQVHRQRYGKAFPGKIVDRPVASYGASPIKRRRRSKDQIEAWNLPTRPTKRTDTRSKTFKGGNVEVDAIPSADLRAIVEEAITQHIDKEVLHTTTVAERSERELLRAWGRQLEAGAP